MFSLILSACVSSGSSGTAEGIKIYKTFTSLEKSQEAASTHCRRYNKSAVFVSSNTLPPYDEFKCE